MVLASSFLGKGGREHVCRVVCFCLSSLLLLLQIIEMEKVKMDERCGVQWCVCREDTGRREG